MAIPSLDKVVAELRIIAEDDSIVADSKFSDLDIDSLDVLEWVFEIEGQADFQIDESLYDEETLKTATIRVFYERINSAASA